MFNQLNKYNIMMRILVVLLILLSALISCETNPSKNGIDESFQIQKATVTLDADKFHAPEVLEAGWTNIHFTNQTEEMHAAHLIKLKNGYSAEQLLEAYADSLLIGGGRPGWMTHIGGLISEPGKSEITLNLDSGNYVWVCVMGPDSLPHFSLHENQPLTVTGSKGESLSPRSPNAVIKMTDFNHELSNSISSGNNLLKITNTGNKYHLAAIAKLNKGSTADDLIYWYTTFNGPPPAKGIASTSAIGPGFSAWLTLDLEPGAYVLFCMANAEGRFHLLDGAVTTFLIE